MLAPWCSKHRTDAQSVLTGYAEVVCRLSPRPSWLGEITGAIPSGMEVKEQMCRDVGFFELTILRLTLHLCCQWYPDQI